MAAELALSFVRVVSTTSYDDKKGKNHHLKASSLPVSVVFIRNKLNKHRVKCLQDPNYF